YIVSFYKRYSCTFFFSSRRRHTSFSRDWSSDVCSSDLCYLDGIAVRPTRIKDLDFKPRSSRPWRKLACKRLHWIAAGFLGASALLFLLSPQDDAAAVARPTANGYLELPLGLPARDTVRRAPDIPAPVAASATEPAAAASV